MATAVCTSCGKEQRWSATRGSRLSDLVSPCCKAPMRGKTAGRPTATKGKKFHVCLVDGRRFMGGLKPPAEWKERHRARGDERFYPANIPCCWFHDPIPTFMPDGWPSDIIREYEDDDESEYVSWRNACRGQIRPESEDPPKLVCPHGIGIEDSPTGREGWVWAHFPGTYMGKLCSMVKACIDCTDRFRAISNGDWDNDGAEDDGGPNAFTMLPFEEDSLSPLSLTRGKSDESPSPSPADGHRGPADLPDVRAPAELQSRGETVDGEVPRMPVANRVEEEGR